VAARSIIRAKPAVVKGSAALGREHEGRLRLLLTMQPPESAQFVTEDRMRAGRALLDPADVQGGRSEVNLLPAQVNQFGHSQAVPVAYQDRDRCANSVNYAVWRLATTHRSCCARHRAYQTWSEFLFEPLCNNSHPLVRPTAENFARFSNSSRSSRGLRMLFR
jgi:hypothetical protein